MKLSMGIRGWLSTSMVGLAVVVAVLALAIHTGLAVHATVSDAGARARALAQEAALLSANAVSTVAPEQADRAVGGDAVLSALFRSALASSPTIIDLGVFDPDGRAMAHSQRDLRGSMQAPREPLARLTDIGAVQQFLVVLGPPRTYEEMLPLRAGETSFGEVRVGVSTVLVRAQLFEGLRAGIWVALAALVMAVLVALGFAHFLSRRMRPMRAGLERLSEGEFGYRLRVEGHDELALLASSINALGERLQSARMRAAVGHVDPVELLDATDKMAEWAKVASGLVHEMADPLNAAALHLGRLKHKWTGTSPEATRHLDVLEAELKRLEHVVVGFRRFAMLGEMQAQWFAPRELAEDISGRAADTLREHRATLRLETHDLPERFWGDPALIRQAVTNLLSNAAQALPGGGEIVLHVRGEDEALVLEVRDQGVGIPEDVRERIFDLYFTTRQEGSGIGLAVVQQVARMHGGTVRLASNNGRGTRIALRFPVKKLEAVGVA